MAFFCIIFVLYVVTDNNYFVCYNIQNNWNPKMGITLALYQPDIAQNLGTILRLGACLGVPIEIIEPCGFPFDSRKMRRAGMDYLDHVAHRRHASWQHFKTWLEQESRRLILLSTKAAVPYTKFVYQSGDVLLLGRESAGVPDEVHNAADHRVIIPMQPEMRSLNVAISGAMVVGEALRQCRDRTIKS